MRDESRNKTIRGAEGARCRRREVAFIIFISIAVAFAAVKGQTDAGKKKVFIQKRSPCQSIEKVDAERIYLKSNGTPCADGSNPVSVEIDASIKRVRVMVDGIFWQEQEIVDLDAIRGVAARGKAEDAGLPGPGDPLTREGKAEAEKLARQFASEEFQRKVHREADRIKKEVFGVGAEAGKDELSEEEDEEAKQPGGILASSERLYLFVSSSIPLSTLRNYAADLAKLSDPNITMVMRGFVGGMKRAEPTLRLISDIVVKDPGCKAIKPSCDAYKVNIIVDPLLYRKYRIGRVPALVYVPSFREGDPGASEGLGEISPYYSIYGDASLVYGIERIEKEARSRSLKAILSRLNQ